MAKNLKAYDSAVELSSIHPDIQSTIWKSVVRISCDEFVGSGLIIDKYGEDDKRLGEGLANSLYILTNLHLLGNDKDMMDRVSADFRKEMKNLETIGKLHAKTRKKQKINASDPMEVRVEQYDGSKELVLALKFILDKDACWVANSKYDCMILKVRIPQNCSLEKCTYDTKYFDTMPVHIFGFPGALVGVVPFQHDYAMIPAQITGGDANGHMLLSTLSTPGLSGSAIVCTARGFPVGYLGGGFDTGGDNQQYQCYGYGFVGVPAHLPRFCKSHTD